MCAPAVTDHQHSHRISRRSFLRGATTLAAAVTLAPALPAAAFPRRARNAVDLTHRLVRTFPSFFGPQVVFDQVLTDFSTAGFFSKEWTLVEHIGTHLDSPGHFDEGNRLVDDLGASDLVAPIVVIDITAKAASDPNAMVEPSDLMAFERRHGRIPDRALVCMDSGWSAKVGDGDEFRGGGGFPDLNFPGFSIDATDWLVAHRDPVGIGVDTMSLDPGNSGTFDVHFGFLATGRYGIESLANLADIPPSGALAFVGPVPWEDGSGAPCRVIAAV